MKNKQFIFTLLIAVAIVILCFEAQVLVSFITTQRLSLGLLTIMFFLLLRNRKKVKVAKNYMIVIWFLGILILWSLVTSLIHMIQGTSVDLKLIISLMLILYGIVLEIIVLEKVQPNHRLFLNCFWILGVAGVLLTFVWLFYYGNLPLFNTHNRIAAVKNYFNDALPAGTSRYFYGLITLNLFSIGYGVGYIKGRKIFKIISWVNLVLILVLLFVANSRQNILFLLTLIFLPRLLDFRSLRFLKFLLGSAVLIVMLYFVLANTTSLIPVIKEKYIERTLEQAEDGSERTAVYDNAINEITENYLIGMGGGNYQKKYGITTHNGYLWVGAELGFIPMILYILFCIRILFFKINTLKGSPHFMELRLIFSYLIAYMFISNNLNDLSREYSFFFILIYFIHLLNRTNKENSMIDKST